LWCQLVPLWWHFCRICLITPFEHGERSAIIWIHESQRVIIASTMISAWNVRKRKRWISWLSSLATNIVMCYLGKAVFCCCPQFNSSSSPNWYLELVLGTDLVLFTKLHMNSNYVLLVIYA
jgi:hypothetical protein